MRYLFIFFLFLSTSGYAQWKSFILNAKGDTLNRVDLKGRKQGPWVNRVETLRGERGFEEEGYFKDGLKTGTWRLFSLEGDLTAVEQYRWGQKDGRNVYLTPGGDPIREEHWRAVNPEHPIDTVPIFDVNDPTKIIRYELVKVEPTAQKHGTWRFYDPFSGRIEKSEQYFFGKLKMADSDDDMAPLAVSGGITEGDSTGTAKPVVKKEKPKLKEIAEFEKKNSGKKKVKYRDGATGG